MKEELSNSIKKKILRQSERTAESPDAEEKPNFLKIINTFAKSMVSLPSFARDLNVARQNLVWLIKLKGGKPTNKADAFFLKADEREAKFEVDMAKQKSEDETGSSPTPEKKTDDKKDPLERIMTSILDIFGLGALGKYFAVGKILGSLKIIGITFLLTTIASGIYKAYEEFMVTGDILASVKKGFVEFIDFITLGAFGKDSIGKLFDDVINFLMPIAETIGKFIDGIGNFFNDKFQKLKKFFGLSREKTPTESESIQVKTPIELLNEQIATLKAKRDSLVTLNEAKKAKVEELRAQKRKKQEEKIAKLKAIPGKIKDKIFEVGKKVVSKVSPAAPAPAAPAPAAPAPAAPAPAAPAPAAPAPEPSKIITPSTGSTKSLSQLVSIQSDTTIVGLNQTLVDRMTAMTEAFKEQTGKKIFVTSGYRSNEEQKELYDRWVQGGKKNKIVSKPKAPLKGIDGLSGAGSPHSSGTAIDVNSKGDGGINVLAGPADKSTGWLEKFGLTRPVYSPDFKINGKPIDKSKQEDWHIVAMGSKPGSPDGGIIPSSGGATIDPSTGKQSGKQLAAASTEVAVNQREQEKRQTPTVINAGITNNNTNIRNTSRAEAKAA